MQSRFIDAGGIRTHYLEAGSGDPLVLLHSAEAGGRAEFSWRYTIPALATRFHVLAPDMVGYGQTEKIFHFTDRDGFRTRHLTAFLAALGIQSAHFMGISFSGGLIQSIAAEDEPVWNIRSIVSISGGGYAPDNAARKVLTHYDGSRAGMLALMQVLFWDARWWADDLLEERWRASIEPGAWEAVAAARFARPGVEKGFATRRADPGKIRVPTLIVGGEHELLREPGCWQNLHRAIPGSELKVYPRARHCPHVEFAAEFNDLALDFLGRHHVDAPLTAHAEHG